MRLSDFSPRKYLLTFLFFVALILFCAITLGHGNETWWTAVVSLPLIFFYPGYYVSRFWKSTLPWASRFSFSVVFSVAIHIALLTLFKSHITLNVPVLSAYLILLNIALYAVYFLYFAKKAQPDTLPYSASDYALLVIPLGLFLSNYFINPVISAGDSYYFIYASISSFAVGRDVSPYVNRPGFIPFVGLLHLAGGESFPLIFRFVLSVLFYLSILMVFDYIRKYSKNYPFSRWLYLLFLAAPVLTSDVDIGRTESLVLVFTVPILIFLSEYLQEQKIEFLVVALLLALIGTRIHELCYVLLLVGLICGALSALRSVKRLPDRKKAWLQFGKILGITVLIAYPYFILLTGQTSFAFVQNSTSTIARTLLHPHWTWWFLSSYAVDGFQIGWNGSQAVLYYLYNGIIFLGAGALLLTVTKKRIRWSLVLPPLIFTTIYFSVAEILPRLNLFYYPDRAWPHLIIGFTVLIIALCMEVTWRKEWLRTITLIALAGSFFAGLIGWVRLTTNLGGFYTKQEVPISNFIAHNLPADSLILTPQSSTQGVVSLYSNRQSIYIPYQTTFTDPSTILQTITDDEQAQNAAILAEAPYQQDVTIKNEAGTILSQTSQILPISLVPLIVHSPQQHIYFYYSFARFDGYQGQRAWWKMVNSYQNYAFFAEFPGQHVVYRDSAGIIIQLQ